MSYNLLSNFKEYDWSRYTAKEIGECLAEIIRKNPTEKDRLSQELIDILDNQELIDSYDYKDANQWFFAVHGLGHLRDSRFSNILIRALKYNPSTKVRSAAAEALAVLGSLTLDDAEPTEIIEALIQSLDDVLNPVKESCIQALNRIDHFAAVKPLLKRMYYHPRHALDAARVLVNLGAACVLKYFTPEYLYSDDWLAKYLKIHEVETKLIDSINDIVPKLVRLSEFPDPKIQDAAIVSLKEIQNYHNKLEQNLTAETLLQLDSIDKKLHDNQIYQNPALYYDFGICYSGRYRFEGVVIADIKNIYESEGQYSWPTSHHLPNVIKADSDKELLEILISNLYDYSNSELWYGRYLLSEYAAKILGQLGDHRAVSVLIEFIDYLRMNDEDPNDKVSLRVVINSLANTKSQEVIPYFIDLLNTNHQFDAPWVNQSEYVCELYAIISSHLAGMVAKCKGLTVGGQAASVAASKAIINCVRYGARDNENSKQLIKSGISTLGTIAEPISFEFIAKYLNQELGKIGYLDAFDESIHAVVYALEEIGGGARVIEPLCKIACRHSFHQPEKYESIFPCIEVFICEKMEGSAAFEGLLECFEIHRHRPSYSEYYKSMSYIDWLREGETADNAIYFLYRLLEKHKGAEFKPPLTQRAIDLLMPLRDTGFNTRHMHAKNGHLIYSAAGTYKSMPVIDGILLMLGQDITLRPFLAK